MILTLKTSKCLLKPCFNEFLTHESFLYLHQQKTKSNMGILNNMFGGKKDKVSKSEEKSYLNWLPLTTIEQLEEIKEMSKTEPVFIFKHSTRCSISSIVLKRFEALFKEEHQRIKVYYLDLLNYRNISNEIVENFEVIHQSPQLLIVKNGVSVQNASHYEITNTDLSIFI